MTVESKTWLRKDPEYKAVAPEEVEIFPGLELQKPKIKKTPKMLEVEELVGDDLGEFLDRKYSIEGLSPNSIRAEIRNMSGSKVNVEINTIRKWLRAYSIGLRSQLEALGLAWNNPEKRERMIAATHSPEANKKRGDAVRTHWQNLSEKEKQKKIKRLRSGRKPYEANRKLLQKQRMQEVLGKNPKRKLTRMFREQGLSVNEIAQKTGTSVYTIIAWMKQLGIERKRSGKGFIKTDKEGKLNLVRQAKKIGHSQGLTPKERAVIDARYPTKGKGVKSFSAILKEGLYPNSQATSRQALQDADKRALKKIAKGT